MINNSFLTQEPEQSSNNSKLNTKNTLRQRLLLTILPTVIIPLAVATAIGYNIIQRRATDQELRQLQENSQLTSRISSTFLKQSFEVPNLVANHPSIYEALKQGTQQAEAKDLSAQDIKKTEKEYEATKLLQPDNALNGYIANAVKEARLGEMFLTEKNGFNIAYSNPTSDFVQSDEKWWQDAKENGRSIDSPKFDDSAKAVVIAISQSIKDPISNQFLGVFKAGVPATNLDKNISKYLSSSLTGSRLLQTIDTKSSKTINTISANTIAQEQKELVGGKTVTTAAQLLMQLAQTPKIDLAQIRQKIMAEQGVTNVIIERSDNNNETEVKAVLEYEGKFFSLTTIPLTEWVAIASINKAEVIAPGQELLKIFSLMALVLASISTLVILLLSRQLSRPLGNLTKTAQQVANGNLDIQAELVGTVEVQTLAQTFNSLVGRIKTLLAEQQAQNESSLEVSITKLVSDIEGAMDGDLTVRASLDSMEMSTVADIFNAIIDNLRDIALQVRESTGQVNSFLQTNEASINLLSDKAVAEASEIRNTLGSVQQMTQSIQTVATSANEASIIADTAYTNAQEGSLIMVETVDSILNLRTTVGETAKRMKRLGESSQKISQVVSLIEEIALKTNLLAINASVEASRAGEQGQGFTVVAEQVGALAEQSAMATREIAQIVAAIQAETQDLATVMELGTSQVVDSSRLVESTKQRLVQMLGESKKINNLMHSISEATVSQSATAQNVTQLMQQVTIASEERSTVSREMSASIQSTSQVAKQLEEKVAQFQV